MSKARLLLWFTAGALMAWLTACGEGSAANQQQRPRDLGTITDNTKLSGDQRSENTAADEEDDGLPLIRDLKVGGGYVYAIVPDSLVVIAVDQPGQPKVVAHQMLARTPLRMTVDGVTAYVACGEGGLQVVNLSKPREPALVGTYDPDGGAVTAVAVSDSLAALGLGDGGMALVDIHDPSRPTEQKRLTDLGTVRDVALYEGRAYVVGKGVQVVNIEKLADVKVLGTYETKTPVDALAFAFGRTVMAGKDGLRLLNLGSPQRPLVVDELASAKVLEAFAPKPSEAAPAATDQPAAVTPPEAAAEPAATTTEVPAPDATSVPADAATAEPPATAEPAEASDKGTKAAKPDVPGPEADVIRLAIVKDRVYVAHGREGVWVIDVVDHKSLKPVTRLTNLTAAVCVAATGDLVVVGTGAGEVVVFQLKDGEFVRAGSVKLQAERSAAPVETPPSATDGNPPPLPISDEANQKLQDTGEPAVIVSPDVPKP